MPTILVPLVYPDLGSGLGGIKDAEDIRLVYDRGTSVIRSGVAGFGGLTHD